ncbi:hypothetical protein FRAHR75_400011 [Frankia sp. Hr75.2]|nr:hypothetical protein FRAHR75_400011 [Frankia sp. Hr75.2]
MPFSRARTPSGDPPPKRESRPAWELDGRHLAGSDDAHHDNPVLGCAACAGAVVPADGDEEVPLEWRIDSLIGDAISATTYAAHRRSVLATWPTWVLRDIVWAHPSDDTHLMVNGILAERGVGW